MRELKFRAWDKDNPSMHYSDKSEFCAGDSPDIWLINDDGIHFEELQMLDLERGGEHCQEYQYRKPNQILMQFTGLLDKNGKEIYEGDILKSEGKTKTKPYDFNIEFNSPWWELSKVVFHEGRFCQVIFAQENSYYGELPSPPRDIFRPSEYKEVVGNIYENSELAEVTGG